MTDRQSEPGAATDCYSWKQRISILAVGHSFNYAFDLFYDWFLYIPVIAILGPLHGGLLLTGGDILISLLFIKFYDWAGQDWLGIEALKDLAEIEEEAAEIDSTLLQRFLAIPKKMVAWSLTKGRIVAFLVLSAFTDPFITTVALRKGKYNGMKGEDWKVFFSCAVVGNIYWTAQQYGLIQLINAVWQRI